jgi:hypothetical protein
MTMTPRVRRLALAVHLTVSVGWLGAAVAYLALGVAATTTLEPQTVRAAWIGMEIVGWYALVPLGLLALATGVLMGLGTPWGLFRYYWVATALVLTAVAVGVLLLHMPGVSATADLARTADAASVRSLGGDLLHPSLGLGLLLTILVLNVYKPPGLTRHGWRVQQRAAQRR